MLVKPCGPGSHIDRQTDRRNLFPRRKLSRPGQGTEIESMKPVHPTTGILAVFVALNYCDVVHVAGFGYPASKSQKHPIHYYGYDTMKSMKDSYHDLTHEAETLKKLEDSGAILYLHPHS
ncbi:unnamed protein product [Coregonus sp. 'balchen']|nr:unnamed protein product [Coregonus sp. 'balchen']